MRAPRHGEGSSFRTEPTAQRGLDQSTGARTLLGREASLRPSVLANGFANELLGTGCIWTISKERNPSKTLIKMGLYAVGAVTRDFPNLEKKARSATHIHTYRLGSNDTVEPPKHPDFDRRRSELVGRVAYPALT